MVNNSYSKQLAVMFDVLQGSILGPLLFQHFQQIYSLYLVILILQTLQKTMGLNISAKNVDVAESLKRTSVSLFKCSEKNLLKGNADKYHFLESSSLGVCLTFTSQCRKMVGHKCCKILKVCMTILRRCEVNG